MSFLLARRRRRNSSPLLFKYTPGDSLAAATFTNPTGNGIRSYIDSNGVRQFANTNVARDSHYVGGVRSLLLEGQRTNLVLWSRDLTNAAWSKRGTAAVAKTATGADGVANSATAITGLGAVLTNDVFTNTPGAVTTGTRCEPSLMLQKVTSSGTVQIVNSQNTSNGTWNVNLALLGSGYERITRSHPAVTIVSEFTGVANLAGLLFGCSSGAPVAINVDFTQLEVGTFSSSPIPTTAAAVTRSADNFRFPWLLVPAAQTVYLKLAEIGTFATVNAALLSMSDSSGSAAVFEQYVSSANNLQSFHSTSGGSVASTVATAPVANDIVEVHSVLFGDGSTQAGRSINGGAETQGAQSGAKALAANWSAQQLWVGNLNGAFSCYGAFQSIKIAAGVQSLATMRGL